MRGFDAEFRDVDHYIRTVTDRIWEGRRLDDVRRYYAPDCVVESPSAITVGVEPVIEATRRTLAQFPDRRLLAEDVIVSGDEDGGFLSSHRILSPMTHAGDGDFGPATMRGVFARTIADCVVMRNRIVHEWLVRDQSAIARQIGVDAPALAQRRLEAAGGRAKPPSPAPPAAYRPRIDGSPVAARYAEAWTRAWTRGDAAALGASHAAHAIVALPGGELRVGTDALAAWWRATLDALRAVRFDVEHLAAVERPGRATALALRWRAHARHDGDGRFGAATGRDVEVMGICHADVEHGRVVREWVLIDEIDTWMQVLTPRP